MIMSPANPLAELTPKPVPLACQIVDVVPLGSIRNSGFGELEVAHVPVHFADGVAEAPLVLFVSATVIVWALDVSVHVVQAVAMLVVPLAVTMAVSVSPLIAPEPLGPLGPLPPLGPLGPGVAGPDGPLGPEAPVAPVGPEGPDAPVTPEGPLGPVAPVAPVAPVGPCPPVEILHTPVVVPLKVIVATFAEVATILVTLVLALDPPRILPDPS